MRTINCSATGAETDAHYGLAFCQRPDRPNPAWLKRVCERSRSPLDSTSMRLKRNPLKKTKPLSHNTLAPR